ncbi:ribulose-phosphate 3-epimerase [Paenibacillus dokdonensis]|uniref:Ribulose-phosphate 3-epimerase n=1 Tax=Paenibacillus dokdonensis TaxID=2567944 RepID=A0ABU6GZC2_9BACL|nr:ribulose-phosphate 3-epimerase [Paenibacillus dokdonensis]MEC0243532.1 ribulose-phosphate 3-epimerase [Paenibacillus dokdonensis]
MIKIAPSILSADFAQLGQEISIVEAAGADWIHVDVMDGHFVPNITLGPPIVSAIKPHTSLPLDVHLMIDKPEQYIADFAKAGADMITVHAEACIHLHRVIHLIKEHGVQAGIAINPGTSAAVIQEVLEDIDMVLIMTVNPGFGGQAFIPRTVQKVRQVRQWLNEASLFDVHIEVDGGITSETAPLVVEAGADVLVAGSAVFGQKDREAAIQAIRSSVQNG